MSIFNQFPIKQFLKHFFFILSPIVLYTVSGRSMYSSFSHGTKVLVQKKWFFCKYKKGDIIVFKNSESGLLTIKRLNKIRRHSGLSRINRLRSWMRSFRTYQSDEYFLIGDNKKESTDSRHVGWIQRKDTIGKVIAS